MIITASTLIKLLRTLGALCADYKISPKKKITPELATLLSKWPTLGGLSPAIGAAMSGKNKVTALYNLGVEIKEKFGLFKEVREYTTPELRMLSAMRTYLTSDSENAFNYICKNASLLRSPVLSSVLSPPDPEPSDKKSLRNLVKKWTGRTNSYSLTLDESKTWKAKDSDMYSNYLKLRKGFVAESKATLMSFVRKSGQATVEYQAAFKYMESKSFPMIPGFTGRIDDQGRWYTIDNKPMADQPTLANYEYVEMNEGSEGTWVFKAVGPTSAYYYTRETTKANNQAKYARVKYLTEKMPSIRKKWLVKVKNFDNQDKTCVCSVILEILCSYAARIGGEPGRGAGTLLVKNASVVQGGINLSYLGKDSIPTKHKIRESDPIQRLLVADLTILLEGKDKSDPIFTYVRNGRVIRVTPSDVNLVFREFGAPPGVTVHKLRTFRGTTLFSELAELDSKNSPPRTEAEAMERYNHIAERVGALLNHQRGVGTDKQKVTGSTAIASYIDGDVQVALWDRWGFRPPKNLEYLFSKEGE